MRCRYYIDVNGQARRLTFVKEKPWLVQWHPDFLWQCLDIVYKDSDYVTNPTIFILT